MANLLKRRRGATYQPVIPTQELLERGLFLSGLYISLLLVAFLLLSLVNLLKNNILQEMSADVSTHDKLSNEIKKYHSELVKLEGNNNDIASAILSLPVASATLNLLQRSTPKSIQLTSVSRQAHTLSIEGKAFKPAPLSDINAFLLLLSKSKMNSKFPELSRLSQSKKNEDQSGYIFDLSIFLRPEYNPDSINDIIKYASEGYKQRIQLAQDVYATTKKNVKTK